MTNPVPGHSISTPYGKRGSYWSCHEDSNGNGIHTGVDYAAPSGAKVVAARDGTVQHSNHGSAFGNHQVDIPNGGTRDFYAHMRSRVANGTKVKAGDKIGEVGSEGNVTGPHLHFERHNVNSGGWSCSIIVNPQPSIDYKAKDEDEDMPLNQDDKDWIKNQLQASQKTILDEVNRLVGDVVPKPTKDDDENTVMVKTALGTLLDRTKKGS